MDSVNCLWRSQEKKQDNGLYIMSKEQLKDKIKGAWALQTIGVSYGFPTEFKYLKKILESVQIVWADTTMQYWMKTNPRVYDDIYMDLTFVEVFENEGLDAPVSSHAKAYANAKYWLWHANQKDRYNILTGLEPPESGHWTNNPHADDIDFQIESDFAGIMNPGMPNSAARICDKIGHIMNSGDGYYGGVFVAGMYSFAFIENDIPTIINKGLSIIPEESTFYQCINDVVQWHQEDSKNWKTAWQKLEDKWGDEIGCPEGVDQDLNIDAKMNAAYVVLGLLYGESDLAKTMEIATRAGQDSDCNPATAGAIIGTIIGYDSIPDYWAIGFSLIENDNFANTNTSLNKAYEISYKHALELTEKNGGEVNESDVIIKLETPKTIPLEQNFPNYVLTDYVEINQKLNTSEKNTFELEFDGVGIVVQGKVNNYDFEKKYALESPEETLNGFRLMVECYIDGEYLKTIELPLLFQERALEIFFQYELPKKKAQTSNENTKP